VDARYLGHGSGSVLQITSYNGSALIAMVGKDCFAVAGDRRLGVNFQTVAWDFQRIFKIHES
jgi:20S proteasome subunit beta 3